MRYFVFLEKYCSERLFDLLLVIESVVMVDEDSHEMTKSFVFGRTMVELTPTNIVFLHSSRGL